MKYLSLLIASLVIISVFSFYKFAVKTNHTDIGKQLIYKYKSEGIGYSDVTKLYSGDTTNSNLNFFRRPTLQMVKLDIRCDLKKTIIRENPDDVIVAFEIINPEIVLETDGAPINTENIKSEIGRPVIAHITKYGLIKNLKIDSSCSYLTANFIKDILSRVQFVTTDKKVKEWQAEEENTSGTFLAKYKWIADSAGIMKYNKTNKGYIKMNSSQKNQKIIADSRSEISIDTSGEIKKINLSGSEITLFGSDTIAASGNRVMVELVSYLPFPANDIQLLNDLSHSPRYSVITTLSAELSDDAITLMAYKNTLGTDNWETLVVKLNDEKNKTQDDEENLFLKFRALSYLYPENCQKIAAILKTETYNSFPYKVLTRALGATGTSQALNCIADIMETRLTEENIIMDFLPIMAISATPTDKAVDIVKRLAFETNRSDAVNSTAQLALAGMAYHFQKIKKERSDQLVSLILDKMKTESDTLQKILVLSNIGSEHAFPVLRSFINDKQVSGQMKANAISALRLIDIREVSSLLASLAKNKDALLSNAAKETILFRKEYFEK